MKKNSNFLIVLITTSGAITGFILSQFYPVFHNLSWGKPFDSFHLKIMPYYILIFLIAFFIIAFIIQNIIKKIYLKKALGFIQREDVKKIEDAIKEAELKTSGEIRVHISGENYIENCLEEAKFWFYKLKLNKTRERNGILLFIAPNARKFAILGDEGINKVIENNFWDDVKSRIEESFKEKKFVDGIVNAVYSTGEILKKFFPIKQDDKNELSDKVSF
ncbi:MAG: TPM domain-containing protein [Exilispira sp.]